MDLKLVVYMLGLSFILSTRPTETSQRLCHGSRSHKSSRGCEEQLHKFLHNVIQAREDLSWIDQVAYQMHSNEIRYASPNLQENLDAMFFNSENHVWAPEKDSDAMIRQRYKRHSKQTKKHNDNPTYSKNVSANKKNSNSPKKHEHNAGLLFQQNFNSTIKSTQKIRTKNGIATTPDPLEKILQSINVFPAEDDRDDARDAGGGVAAFKFNDDAAKNHFQSGLFKHETVEAYPARSQNNDESFSEKYMRMRRSLKSSELESNKAENNNIEVVEPNYDGDKTQKQKAMNGDLAREIVAAIFNKLKMNGGFNEPISLSRHYTLPEKSMLVEDSNQERNNLALAGVSENPNRLMRVVQEIISEEVGKKTCSDLQSDLHDFLGWLIDIDNNGSVDSLQKSIDGIVRNEPVNKSIADLDEWYRKAQNLRNLLTEYDGLPKKEKNKVQAIYEYLVSRFEFAEAYIEASKSHELPLDQLQKISVN